MAIKYLSINNEVLNIDNIPKLDQLNTFYFNHDNILSIKRPNLDAVNTQDPVNSYIAFTDKNNIIVGRVGIFCDDSSVNMTLRVSNVYNSDDQSRTIGQVRIACTKTGQTIIYGQTPPSDSRSNEIPTCTWIRSLLTRSGITVTN